MLERTWLQAKVHGRRRNELPHALCIPHARLRPNCLGVESAFLKSDIEKMRWKVSIKHRAGNGPCVSILTCAADTGVEPLRGFPAFDIGIYLRDKFFRHGRFALSK